MSAAPHVCLCPECSTGFDLECRFEKRVAGLLEAAKRYLLNSNSLNDDIEKDLIDAIAEAEVPPRAGAA